MNMDSRRIYIDFYDLERLRLLVKSKANQYNGRQDGREAIRALADDLDKVVVITPQVSAPFVVTMNSRINLRNEETGETAEYTLAFPGKSSRGHGKLSVLSPLGATVLGRRELETVSVKTDAGVERYTIAAILHQPESTAALV